MDSDQTCTSSMKISNGNCAGYCEVRNTFFYGKEVAFAPLAHCSADETCSIQSSQSSTITQTYTFNVDAGLSSRSVEDDSLVTRGDDAPEDLLKAAFNAVSLRGTLLLLQIQN